MTACAKRWKRWAVVAARALAPAAPPALAPVSAAAAAAVLAVLSPAPLHAQAAPSDGPIDVAQINRQAFQSDVNALNTGRTQADRDEAARRLVARQSAEGRARIRAALDAQVNLNTRIAAARAVADDPAPDAALVPLLAPMLGVNQAATEAAANALASFKETPAAARELLNFAAAANQPAAMRAAAVRALGAVADKATAQALVGLLAERDPAVRNAAADALADMTQARENGRDPAAWQQWWAANQGKSAEKFKADLLDRHKRQRPPPPGDLDALLQDLIRLAAPDQKPAALMRTLTSPDAGVRAAGVRLFLREVLQTGQVPQAALQRVRAMVGDAAPEVRIEVAKALGRLNDKPSLEALLAQLVQDPDPSVRAALCESLVPLNDLRAVDTLLSLLNDPSLRVAVTAAESLSKLGPLIRGNAETLARVTAGLRRAMDGRGRQPGNEDLRAACAEALVPLKDPAQGQLFLALLNQQRESPRTRRAAVQGLGVLGNPGAANALINWLRDERDPTVRQATLESFPSVGTMAAGEAIYSFTQSGVENVPAVREAAWAAFLQLLPSGTAAQLADWADVRFKGDADRRLPVLLALAQKHQAAGMAQDLALRQLDIGEAYMNLKTPAPRPAEAVPYFRESLKFFRANNAQPQVTEGVVRWLMVAHLKAKQYADAAKFAEETIKLEPQKHPIVASLLVNEAEDLLNKGQARDVLALEAETAKIALDRIFVDRLGRARDEAKRQLDGATPRP